MSNLQIFNNPQFGEVRTVISDKGEPMFCLADVCKALELTNPTTVKNRLDKEDVQLIDLHALNLTEGITGNSMANFITESGFYDVILQSTSSRVKPFRKWVTSEVLPEIRKHGGYMVINEDDAADELMTRALVVAQKTLERRNERIRHLEAVNTEQAKAISEMSPKANYYNIILQSPSTITVTQIAQDYGMSAKAFNKLLHTLGIQRKIGRQWVLYSGYIANGYVQSATEPMKNSQSGRSYTYSRWTQKGRIFLYNELKNRNVLPLIEQTNR